MSDCKVCSMAECIRCHNLSSKDEAENKRVYNCVNDDFLATVYLVYLLVLGDFLCNI